MNHQRKLINLAGETPSLSRKSTIKVVEGFTRENKSAIRDLSPKARLQFANSRKELINDSRYSTFDLKLILKFYLNGLKTEAQDEIVEEN